MSDRKGFCIWLTGLPCSGKSTIAHQLKQDILDHFHRPVTLLDGDEVRQFLSSGLGFSRKDRDLNVARVAFVASEIARHSGISVVSLVSPYHDQRTRARIKFPPNRFVEVFVDTPLDLCIERDVKGMYQRALDGEIKSFTGISDPYQRPRNPEITITTANTEPKDCSSAILRYLLDRQLLPVPAEVLF